MNWKKWGFGIALTCLTACAAETVDDPEGALAEANEELSRGGLSPDEERLTLKLIDDICGDTWCEGDHNFSFDRLRCRAGCDGAGSCRLTFRVFSHDTELETGPTFVRTCETPGYAGFDSLVTTQNGYQSLQPTYYQALSECISRVEQQLPR